MKSNKKTIYDFHTHIRDFSDFREYFDSGIIPVINIRSCDEYENIQKYSRKYSDNLKVYMSVGAHPFDSDKTDQKYNPDNKESYLEDYEKLISETEFLGEIGMDGYWCDVDSHIQEKVFRDSLKIAEKRKKTVVLHTKSKEKEIYDIISEYDLRFIIHWYSCENYIEKFIEKGCYFTVGPAIFVDENVRRLVKMADMDRLLVETDGIEALEWLFERPFTPEEIRPALESVISEIAEIKSMKYDEVYDIIAENSKRLLDSAIQGEKVLPEQIYR